MRDFIEEVILPIVAGFVVIVILALCIGFPIAWFDGHAKANYLRRTQGIEIPWYEATFLNVEINNVNARVESK